MAHDRKMLSLARDYATRREAFGSSICKHPLHIQTLARMEVCYVNRISIGSFIFLNFIIRCSVQVEVRGCCALFFDLAYKLGCEELGTISEEVNIGN